MAWRSSAPKKTITTTRTWDIDIKRRRAETNTEKDVHSRSSEPLHSESLPELSNPELESEESPLSASRLVWGVAAAAADAPPRFSKSSMRSSSCRIFSASFSSSMLFRLSPPVPVPFPVRLRLGCAGCRRGRRT